ncbi:hypothetical protein Zmor_025963 [Zophobas morio]|uniref:Uncharacterized protein n=1 Tax=Zophobas morio TaxID=2755281 RepID=A0AA38M520_9CUCU|nr:hypothetical protein Zmor_025963 [Zophobas morio]
MFRDRLPPIGAEFIKNKWEGKRGGGDRPSGVIRANTLLVEIGELARVRIGGGGSPNQQTIISSGPNLVEFNIEPLPNKSSKRAEKSNGGTSVGKGLDAEKNRGERVTQASIDFGIKGGTFATQSRGAKHQN